MKDKKLLTNEWPKVKLGDICDIAAGGTPSTKRSEYWGGKIPWMRSGDLNLRTVNAVEGRITQAGLDSSSTWWVPKHSVLIGLAGQGKTRGTVAVNNIELTTNQSVAAFLPNNQLFYKYLYYNLDSRYEELRQMSAGDGGRGGLNLSLLGALRVDLPPLSEQKRIVRILETWDEAIHELEIYILCKTNAYLQLIGYLVTGKVRLPGFKYKWRIKPISTILRYERPDKYIVSSTEYCKSFLTPVLTANKGFILGYSDEESNLYRDIPAIIFDDFTTSSRYVDFAFKVKSSAIKILKPRNDDFDLRFVFERMQNIKFVVGEHKRHYISDYQHLEIAIPDIDEQKAIAAVAQSADLATKLLIQKLSCLRQQREYLINNLVAGKIRLTGSNKS
jgi:type I restriction enzyme S subunit